MPFKGEKTGNGDGREEGVDTAILRIVLNENIAEKFPRINACK
jgi:hypothetical protein